MGSTDNILELASEAVSAATLLKPADPAAIEQLQSVLSRIMRYVDQDDHCPSEIIEKVKGTTSDAESVLKKLLENEIADTEKAMEDIGEAISQLQGLIDQILASETQTQAPAGDAAAVEDSQADEQDQGEEEPQVAAEMVIQEDDVPLLLDFITESNEHIESSEAGLLELEDRPGDSEVLNQIFRAFHTIKGMAGFLNLVEIGSLAHSAENLLDLARKGELVLAGGNTDLVFESIDMIKKMIAALGQAIEAGEPLKSQAGLSDLIARLKAAADGEIPVEPVEPPPTREEDEQMESVLGEPEERQQAGSFEAVSKTTKAKAVSSDEKIKVSTTRLDNLINMAGELAIAQLMVAEQVTGTLAGEHELIKKISHQNKIVRELQELSMAMRMVPINGVFQKMARLVRDLSHKFEKKITFSTKGNETELDRSIVDKIADPLVHMVRNSLDHGIESAEDRTKAGKNPTGTLELRAFHQAGNIVIEIEDDGKGLDKDRILKKAIDQGVVDPNQEMSDEDIFKLIFHAGLSTAQKITSVSGRGVGMDVVKKNIEALRGKIEVASTPGKGTIFTIRMPLTLAIIDGQIVKIGDQRYIIPINSIVESLKPTTEQISTVQKRAEIFNIRGKLISLVRLYKLFGITSATEDPTEALVVIVEEDGRSCGLLVDELMGQQQVVIKNLGQALGNVKGVSGGAIMGDGKISLILDVPGLIELSQR